ncbi:nickel-dependent hydrogenase large subunit [Clostridium sp. A1-XYC3]|uniref:Nickel-dependent hydrogenase large subunit n=1 Tax=Clostridium tanneri TaxID=3037988 RepID=A0ABU4JYA2_9CLOT|nr:nickel-dependent hydrogenase large subunit [Clostridium sp. A1-XYC3]MDW8803105.1 nickel-dependent hydrogenase large subunit [Clostridium sp. A1-XYC3]
MGKIIRIDPVTRISGFLDIKIEVEESIITKAETSGLLYRGFEKMLKGRSPLDAVYFTERICGICSIAHGTASTRALEDALNINVAVNDLYLRDIMHGFDFLQNHLRQFYFFTVPSYAKMPDIKPLYSQEYTDFRMPDSLNKRMAEHYNKAIKYSRLAHEGLAVLGGKAPHVHGIFVGGVTVNIDSYKLEKVKSIIAEIKEFVDNNMIEDVDIISRYYPDYFEKGISYANFMSYGLFDKYPSDLEISYVQPGISILDKKYPLDTGEITEHIKYSWYSREKTGEEANIKKPDGYSFIKAPRYNGLPMEVGPLARMMISGYYTRGNSCMDRNIARVLETKKILEIVSKLTERVELKVSNQQIYEIPDSAFGMGITDTIRGSLGHWIEIKNKVIKYYDIITPTAWNLSPKDDNGTPGVGEKSLIGSKINDIKQPVEAGRIIRSFDPCISCATHVIGDGQEPIEIEILV